VAGKAHTEAADKKEFAMADIAFEEAFESDARARGHECCLILHRHRLLPSARHDRSPDKRFLIL
jgi:hypothetical protein